MPEFTGRFQFRRIHSPKGDAALVGFACGEDDFGVDGLVRNQCVPGIKCERYPAIWILEDVTNSAPRTIGVAAWVLLGIAGRTSG